MRGLITVALFWLLAATSSVHAHVSMLFPSTPSAKKGDEVLFTYQWGHPFEHQLFDAPRPNKVVVLEPDPTRLAALPKITDLSTKLTKISLPGADDKKVTAWQFRFTPRERGDYVFLLTTAPIFLKEEGYFIQDTVKVVLHVQAQQGWDAALPDGMQLVPLTRPYGLQPNLVVQARLAEAKNADYLVEIERYHAAPPKELPPDEQITRTMKTDPNGVVTASVTEPGWWALTARRAAAAETLLFEGNQRPFHKRAILWLFVDEKSAAK